MSDWDCPYCIYYSDCDLEDHKNHAYNLRDNTADCFVPRDDISVPPWLDPRTECYRCMKHTYENCTSCKK